MYFLFKVSEALSAFVSFVGKVVAWLAIPLMLIIVLDITTRKLLDAYPGLVNSWLYFGSTKLQEMEWHLHAVLFLLCLGFAYVRNAHVRVELIRERFAPRVRAWIELVGGLVFLIPYCYLILTYGWQFTERSYMMNEVSSATTGLSHRWIIKGMLPLGFLILGIAAVAIVLKHFVYLFGPAEFRKPTGDMVEVDEIEALKQQAAAELAAQAAQQRS